MKASRWMLRVGFGIFGCTRQLVWHAPYQRLFKLVGGEPKPLLAYAMMITSFSLNFGRCSAMWLHNCQSFCVGQRWDLEVTDLLDFEGDWVEPLRRRTWRDGKLHERAGSDYFVFPRACFQHIPDFTVGRAGWDNWMIFKARQENWPVVDCTSDLDIITKITTTATAKRQPHYVCRNQVRISAWQADGHIVVLNDASHRLVHGNSKPCRATGRANARVPEPPNVKIIIWCSPATFTLPSAEASRVEFGRTGRCVKLSSSRNWHRSRG